MNEGSCQFQTLPFAPPAPPRYHLSPNVVVFHNCAMVLSSISTSADLPEVVRGDCTGASGGTAATGCAAGAGRTGGAVAEEEAAPADWSGDGGRLGLRRAASLAFSSLIDLIFFCNTGLARSSRVLGALLLTGCCDTGVLVARSARSFAEV